MSIVKTSCWMTSAADAMRLLSFLVLTVSLLLAGCSVSEPPAPVAVGGTAFHSMAWTVKMDALPAGQDATSVQRELQGVLDAANAVLSTYQPDTELMRFNRAPLNEWVTASPMLFSAVATAMTVSAATQGRYDVTVGPLVSLWGFGPDAVPQHVPSDDDIARARSRIGWENVLMDGEKHALKRRQSVQLDLSSVGEGVAVDALAARLAEWGVRGFMVSVAGCTRVQGTKADGSPWVIAIEKPDGSSQVQQVLRLKDQVISTSGSYRNYREIDGVRYSHTIDPVTGRPIMHKGVSVSVVMTGDTTTADAWATALNVLGPDEGYALAASRGMAAYFIRHTDKGPQVRYTPAFQALLPAS